MRSSAITATPDDGASQGEEELNWLVVAHGVVYSVWRMVLYIPYGAWCCIFRMGSLVNNGIFMLV